MGKEYSIVRKKLAIIILSLVSIILIFNIRVLADPSDNNTANSYDIQMFTEDQSFNMPKNEASYFFNIPKEAQLSKDLYLDVHYAVSNTLIDNLSNMSVNINGAPIETKWIHDVKKMSPDWWKVSIPVDKLKIGAINEVSIQSNHRSIEGDCADIDNPSNWVTIYKDSKLHLSTDKLKSPYIGDFYAQYFENFANKQAIAADFVLPKTEDKNAISALLKLSSSVGNIYSDRAIVNYNVRNSSEGKQSDQNKILIGNISEWQQNANLILPKEKLQKDQGFLSITDSTKESPYYETVVSGENNVGLNKAVDFMTNNTILSQIKDKSLVIDSQVDNKYNKFTQSKKGMYRFSDWGYGNINLAGVFHKKSTVSFVQPNGLQGGSGSYINLKFKHSKLLLSDRSLINIYINGQIMGSEKLSNSNADGGNLKVTIPESALRKPVIKVDIECYNYIGKVDCSKDYYDSAWTLIDSDSEIGLMSGKAGVQPSLDTFPFFNMNSENKQPKIVIGFSKEINDNYLQIASTIATRAGQNSKQVFNWDVYGDNLKKAQKEDNMIFIGSFNDIKLPSMIKNELPILPLGNNKFKIKEGLQVVPETLKNKIVIQAIRSPWNFYKCVYVVAYDNDDNLKILKEVLNNTEDLWKMQNQVSIIDNTKEFHNMLIYDSKDNKVPVTAASIIQWIQNKTGFPWWVLLVSLALIVYGVITIIRLRKSKNQFKDIANKMKKEEGFNSDEEVEEDKEIKNEINKHDNNK
jgi:hypothetical protein